MSESEIKFKFEQLLSLFVEGELEGKELEEFRELLQSKDEFADMLQLQLEEDQRLELWNERQSGRDNFVEKVKGSMQLQDQEFTEQVVQYTRYNAIKKPNRIYQIAFLATAACLCISILYIFLFQNIEDDFDLNVALVTHINGETNLNLNQGDSLQTGLIELKTGLMDLTFYRGARLSVVAPAKLEILDNMSVRCVYGKVKAIVPAVAKGFTVYTPDSKVIDLGTEFGLEVSPEGASKVHVFDGEVETYPNKGDDKKLIVAGQSIKPATGEIAEANIGAFDEFSPLSSSKLRKHLKKAKLWEKLHERHSSDPRLLIYYDFENKESSPQTLMNKSIRGSELDAAIVGTLWSNGPWIGKSALEFVRSSDRLRIYVPGAHKKMTLACWVRVDALIPSYTSLLLSDGYEPGDIHWQINKNRTIQLGLKQDGEGVERFFAENAFNKGQLGQWTHLAITIDLENKIVRQYKNGKIILEREAKTDLPVSIGYATIGNWDNGKTKIKNLVRNLTGSMAEFMIYKDSLSEYEIRELALLPEVLHN